MSSVLKRKSSQSSFVTMLVIIIFFLHYRCVAVQIKFFSQDAHVDSRESCQRTSKSDHSVIDGKENPSSLVDRNPVKL